VQGKSRTRYTTQENLMASAWLSRRFTISLRALAQLVVLISLATLSAAAHAQDTLVESATYGLAKTNYGYSGPSPTTANGTTFLTVAQYHPYQHLYAQLQSVTISWTATVQISYSFYNSGTTSQTYYANITGQATLFGPGSTSTILGASYASVNYGSSGSPLALAAGASSTSGLTSQATNTATTYASTYAALLPYTGSGNVQFDLTGYGVDNLNNGGGNITLAYETLVGGTVTVTFTYATPVPEPSTWAMIASGCVTGYFILRRRKSVTTVKSDLTA
jgi:hypothetical protein